MASKNLKKKSDQEFLDETFDFEKAVKVKGPLSAENLKQARAKVLKSVRYDAELLEQVQTLATREGIPYQTLMNSLLKTGLQIRNTDILKRLDRIERKIFKKHG
jgi:predicted DNA binding CopG/RHH family protein